MNKTHTHKGVKVQSESGKTFQYLWITLQCLWITLNILVSIKTRQVILKANFSMDSEFMEMNFFYYGTLKCIDLSNTLIGFLSHV